MSLKAATRERVHALWDGLADFDAAQIDAALDYLMAGLCELVGGQNADWIGVVRLADDRGDSIGGWRPSVVRFLHFSEKLIAAAKEQARRLNGRIADDAVGRVAAQSGRFRACRLCDVVQEDWFESDFYRASYRDSERADAVYVAFPLNADAESWFGFFRVHGQPAFTAQERDLLAYALRGIKWFHPQLLLSHGLLVAGMPLTEVERRVLQGLLSGRAEKAIAALLGQSHNTTHEYVTAIYRKFGVNNRPALMALWLGTTGMQQEREN